MQSRDTSPLAALAVAVVAAVVTPQTRSWTLKIFSRWAKHGVCVVSFKRDAHLRKLFDSILLTFNLVSLSSLALAPSRSLSRALPLSLPLSLPPLSLSPSRSLYLSPSLSRWSSTVCPYFLMRDEAQQKRAELVLMPYNYVIDPSIRDTLHIDWGRAVVILDEAHNLDAVCSSAASFDLTAVTIAGCIEEVTRLL